MNRDTRHNKAMDSTLGRPLSRQAARGSLPNLRRSAIARTALTYFSDLSRARILLVGTLSCWRSAGSSVIGSTRLATQVRMCTSG